MAVARVICVILIVLAVTHSRGEAAGQLQLARVTGVLLESDGSPLPSALVELTDQLGAALAQATTDQAGRFAFDGVSPGAYVVRMTLTGGRTVLTPLAVQAGLPIEVTVRVPRVSDAVYVEAPAPGESASSRAGIAGESLQRIPALHQGRALQDVVATLPGWSSEDNGLLHARGVDDGFLFVIDGIPVYERLDAVSNIAPALAPIESINVITGYVPPEFGYKAGGVIEIRSGGGDQRRAGRLQFGGGSDRLAEGGALLGGMLGSRVAARVDASAHRSSRFLDPVHPDNLHNRGHGLSGSSQLEWLASDTQRVSLVVSAGRNRFDVPNTEEQEEAGQDQRQSLIARNVTLSWQRVAGASTVIQAGGYHRTSSAALAASAFDVPLSPDADRRLTRAGALASVTHSRGAHLLKAGVEAQRLSIRERFAFAITDRDEAEEAGFHDEAIAHGPDRPFRFEGRATPRMWSVYLQDTWQAAPSFSLSGGLRYDRSTLLLPRSQVSPRLGASYRRGAAGTLRLAVSRFFQPPQPENLLLSSSEQARALSPFSVGEHDGGAGVEPERQWAFEAGFEHFLSAGARLDVAYWRRWARQVADPNVFLGTTIIFPNAVGAGRADGLDVRLEVPKRGRFSGYGGLGLSRVRQTGPITGGLFLEDEVEEIGDGDEFVPDHDQRLAASAGITWEHSSRLALSLVARYESGTPIQREDDELDELADRSGSDRVDFGSGRVKPRTVVSVLASVPLLQRDAMRADLRAQVINLFDAKYAYNFGNPFSGTHFGAPRSASLSAAFAFR